jgi:hypothetical protein
MLIGRPSLLANEQNVGFFQSSYHVWLLFRNSMLNTTPRKAKIIEFITSTSTRTNKPTVEAR